MKKPTYSESVWISWVSLLIEILYIILVLLIFPPKYGNARTVIMLGIGIICMVGTVVFRIKFCRCPNCDKYIFHCVNHQCPFCQNYLD